MRVYLPASLAIVSDLLSSASMPAPVHAYAVTDVLRAWADQSGPSDDEELELVALSEAARGSLRLLAAAPAVAARRVVLAADVPDRLVRVDDRSDLCGPGQVTVTEAVELAWVRAAHVDAAELEPDVRAAAGQVLAADAEGPGSATAEAVVATLEEHELLWYASEELAVVVAPSA